VRCRAPSTTPDDHLEVAAELGLAWPSDAKAHPVDGFSEVQLTPATREDYAATVGKLDAAITLHLDTFRHLGLAGGQANPDAGGKTRAMATVGPRPSTAPSWSATATPNGPSASLPDRRSAGHPVRHLRRGVPGRRQMLKDRAWASTSGSPDERCSATCAALVSTKIGMTHRTDQAGLVVGSDVA
jgi:hypothetical protein